MKGLEGVAALELLAGDGNLESVTEVAVEQAHNLLHGTLDAVGLGHEDAIVLGDEVSVGADLASAVAHARSGDDINERERLLTEVSEGLRVGQGVCDGDNAIAGVSVNGADVAGGDVEGVVVLDVGDSGGLGLDDGIGHGVTPF